VLDVVVEGGNPPSSVLKEYQLDKVRGSVTHVDLQEVRLDQPIHATVPLHVTGESVGAKEGGVLNQVLTELNVEALPMEVPASLDFDVSDLRLGDSAHLSQVVLPDGVTLLDDGDIVFVAVTQPTREVEPEPEEGGEGAEGEAAEGEEPTAEGEGDGEAAAESSDSEE
jgi:large subunit ribosomal protein L25